MPTPNPSSESGMSSEFLQVAKVQTEQLILGTTSVNGITSENENDPDKLSTARALYLAVHELTAQLNAIDPTNNAFRDKSVITEPCISPIFESGHGWEFVGFQVLNNTAMYDGALGNPAAHIKVPSSAFPGADHYLFKIIVDVLEEGSLRLIDKNNVVLEVITEPGSYYYEVNVDNAQSATFKLMAHGFNTSSLARVTYFGVHRITERFYTYLQNKLNTLLDIDGEGLATKTYIDALLEDINTTFAGIINSIVAGVNGHHSDLFNPHRTTWEQTDAAWSGHGHTLGELHAAADDHIHTPESIGAALEIHEHPQYMTETTTTDLIVEKLESELALVPMVAPLTIISGSMGIIPNEFSDEHLQAPVQLLIPPVLYHDAEHAYDDDSGFASSNKLPVMGYPLSGLLSMSEDVFTAFDVTGVYLHYQFHTKRKMSGYKIHMKEGGGKPIDWDFYSNFKTFIHHGTARVEDTSVHFTFPDPIWCDAFTFHITEVELVNLDPVWFIRVEPIFVDVPELSIGITTLPFTVAIPRSGSVDVFKLNIPENTVITPTENIEDSPIYIYLDMEDGVPAFGYTYIPPEYDAVHHGLDITTDKFPASSKVLDHYVNPIFGRIKINGVLNTDPVLQVLSSTPDSYRSDAGVTSIDIIHKFDTPIALSGYKLIWADQVRTCMPESWSLEITAIDAEGEVVNLVMDSVNVNIDVMSSHGLTGTAYYKSFARQYQMIESRLCLRTSDPDGIGLTQYTPYYLEDFYSIPENTMYHLGTPVDRIYIGKAQYIDINQGSQQRRGYLVTNDVLGKSCACGVNNLLPCQRFASYVVRNPFNTKSIATSIRVVYVGNEEINEAPTAVVEEITSEVIKIRAYTEHRFVVEISRNW